MHKFLLLIARRPIAGQTKTRLCPPLDAQTAAALYACFLHDTLATARGLSGVQPLICYTPADAGPYFAEFAPGCPTTPQRGDGLGERLAQAFAETFAMVGSHPASIVALSTDSPDLPASYIESAFTCLEQGADVALGPADDGGYYLIGLRAPRLRLLREVQMSTPNVLSDTLALARSAKLRTELLPSWYDIDTAADLERLRANLATHPQTAPATASFLQTHL